MKCSGRLAFKSDASFLSTPRRPNNDADSPDFPPTLSTAYVDNFPAAATPRRRISNRHRTFTKSKSPAPRRWPCFADSKSLFGIVGTASKNAFVGFVEGVTAAKSEFGIENSPASKNSWGGRVYRFRLEGLAGLISEPGPRSACSVWRFKKVKWPVRVHPPVSMKKALPSFIMAEMVRCPCTTAWMFLITPL